MNPQNLVVPVSVVERTLRLLRGFRRMETAALWFGIFAPDTMVVTTVIRPQQVRTFGSFEIDRAANAEVAMHACDHGIRLVAQLHTHPGKFVDHSPGDDRGAAFVFPGLYSIVVPQFGRRGLLPLNQCGVHRYADGRFLRLTDEQIANDIRVIPDVLDFL